MSLFNTIKTAFTETVVGHIAANHNEQASRIQQAIDLSSAAIVGGLIKRIMSETGMNLVYNTIQKYEIDINDTTKNNLSEVVASGDKVLNTLLPSFKSLVSGLISRNTGLRNSVSSSVVGFTMLAVADALKKQVAEKKYDAQGLAGYLGEQREHLLAVSPDHNHLLIETLGLQNVLSNFTVPRNSVEESIPDMAKVAPKRPFIDDNANRENINIMPYLKWVGLGLAIVGILAAAFYVWKNVGSTADGTDSTEVALNEAQVIKDPITKDTTQKIGIIDTLKKATASPIEAYMVDMAKPKGKTLQFDNVDFIDNTTQLKPESNVWVTNLTDLLKKYPTSEIKFIAYANDAQSPNTNKLLSVKRAFALKQQMIDGGISYVRVDAEGRGNGVNPKDTTGRKQVPLREVYIKFIKK